MNWIAKIGLTILLASATAQAECIDSLWQTIWATENTELGNTIVLTQDNNVVAGGYFDYTGVTQGSGWLAKVNPVTGVEIWSRQYTSGIGTQNIFLDVDAVSDGGFVGGGWARYEGTNAQYYFIQRVNANGDSVWARTFGDNALPFQGRCVAAGPNNSFAVGGRAHSLPGGFGGHDWLLIKTDANGDSVWSVLIGGPFEDTCHDMIVSQNSTFVMMGTSLTDSSRLGRLAGVSQNGQVMWNRTYDMEPGMIIDGAYELPNMGGYMVVGYFNNGTGYSSLVMEVSDAGVRRWHQVYDLKPDADDFAFSIEPDGLGGWYVMGRGYTTNPFQADIYIQHISSCGDALETSWFGNEYNEDMRKAVITPSGQIVFAGSVVQADNQREMLVSAVSVDTCNIPPCTFDWVTPDHDELLTTPEVTFSWTRSHDPEGEDITYLLHWESDYWYPEEEEQDVVLTDTFYVTHVPWPLAPLDEIFSFNWRVWATDGQDTVEAASGENMFRMDIILDAGETTLAPHEFSLSAYPNPFNPTTTLSYSVDKTQSVTLALFDVQGRLVQSLMNEVVAAGAHTISFDGSVLASGIYFANLRAGNQTRIAKLVLMK